MTAARILSPSELDAERLIALRALPGGRAARPVSATLGGDVPTRRKGAGQEIEDIRDYAWGDDIRHLDPAATARTGALHVRRFREERDRVVILVADLRPAMFWGIGRAFLSIAAAEALAWIGWRAVEQGARVGCLAVNGTARRATTPGRRERAMLGAIGALTGLHRETLPGPTPPLDGLLSGLARIAPRGAEVVIASSFETPGAGLSPALAALAANRQVTCLALRDGLAERLPPGSYPVRDRTGARRMLRPGRETASPPAPPGLPGRVVALDAALPVTAMLAALEMRDAGGGATARDGRRA